MQKKRVYRGGFALPTVLIASVVMLTILAVSVTSVAAVRTSLKTQYYEQLAKEAGEAGVAYAKACLAKNGNTPLWTNANPLKPSTDCSGTPIAGLSCPTDAGCSVVSNDTLRSSFSVPAPTTNTQGKAVTIPNSGYVNLLRGSNGQVWRTYNQPAVQAAVVPDLCSGSATSGLGWSNAAASSGANKATIAEAPSAVTITLADTPLPAGEIYFRRDFAVSTANTYKVSALTNSAKDKVELYIDGTYMTTSQGALASTSTALSVGCHTISARLTNKTLALSYSQFTASVGVAGSSTTVVGSDTAWRASSGSAVSFSTSNFYADPSVWAPVVGYGTPLAVNANAAWPGGGDALTAMISPPGNGCPGACPFNSTAYLRDSKDIYVAADTYVVASLMCDNICDLYIDGQPILEVTWNDISRQSFTLTKGYHHVGIALYNSATAVNPAGAAMSIVNSGGGTVFSRTDKSWLASTSWDSGYGSNVMAYESTFDPSPKEIIDPTSADVLIVGGGGGGGRGGGGGGGGVITQTRNLSVGTYAVTVGGGGAGSPSGNGGNGGTTTFNGVTALGGGGGGGASSVALAGNAGASGGGGGLSVSGTDGAPGGAGTVGQGNNGGYGFAYSCSPAGGGGGAGSPGTDGTSAKAGNGGAAVSSVLTGVPVYYGGGGGAGSWCLGFGTGGENAGTGATATATAGVANTGGGGGGGGANGGSGGAAGGSGIVVIRIRTGSATVSATGSYTTSTPTINGVAYTVYRFTGNGSFIVSALSPS